jgi:hypothetical protein
MSTPGGALALDRAQLTTVGPGRRHLTGSFKIVTTGSTTSS